MLTCINWVLAKMALFKYAGNYFKNSLFLCIRGYILGMMFQISGGMSNVPNPSPCIEIRLNLPWFQKTHAISLDAIKEAVCDGTLFPFSSKLCVENFP